MIVFCFNFVSQSVLQTSARVFVVPSFSRNTSHFRSATIPNQYECRIELASTAWPFDKIITITNAPSGANEFVCLDSQGFRSELNNVNPAGVMQASQERNGEILANASGFQSA